MVNTLTWRLYGQPRVSIDLNDRARGGLTRARLEELPASIAVGDLVRVYEPEDAVAAPAFVREVDHSKGLAFLEVDWSSLHDDNGADILVSTRLTNTARSSAEHEEPRVTHVAVA
jgi:hypothetical protein